MLIRDAFYLNWKWWVCLPYLLLLLPLVTLFYLISGVLWLVSELSTRLYRFLWWEVNYSLGSWVGLRKVSDWIWREDNAS